MGHKPFGTELDHDSFLDDNNRLVLVVCDPVITNTFERHVAKQRTSFYVLEDEKLPIGSVPLNMLQNSVTDYLIRKKVILNKQKTFYTMTEEELILNRLQNIVDIEQQNMNICPTHRYTYGTGFRIDNHCYHPDHQKERQSKKKTYKVATLQQCNNIPSFPISGTLCSKYHTKMYAQDNLTTISQPSIPNIIKSAPGSTASVASAEERVTSRETANSLLAFGCTRHAVKAARSLRGSTTTPLQPESHESIICSRIDPSLTEHFISWLIETDLMASVLWGYSQLQLDSSGKLSIPKQIIQAKKSHVILQYKQHYLENNFTRLSDRQFKHGRTENFIRYGRFCQSGKRREKCDHEHTYYCKDCIQMAGLLDNIVACIHELTNTEEKNEVLYDFNQARKAIIEQCRHVLRSVQQDAAKAEDIKSLDEETAYLTIDWAQKVFFKSLEKDNRNILENGGCPFWLHPS
ncbi:unnamed protein product [Didymodactylos carnosus]|uniref:Uncharacterized protein n=1 Tax=Didymodactylos carnosus TaxID=1234261 RepID=A0A814I6F0_9BILA|nr:unnamed protein product [Didymodactylos carnosus]CAF3791186.1 unnamed protein product [Didymodactylos carnosus]